MAKKKQKKPWAVFIAIALAIAFGSIFGPDANLFGIPLYPVFDVAGQMFLNALTLVVVPLVSASIITGIARIGSEGAVGRLGAKMFTFYLGTSLAAILIGLFFVNLLQPGSGHTIAPAVEGAVVSPLQQQLANHETGKALVGVLISIVPPNIVGAFARGEMLALIFFSLLFGFSLAKVKTDAGHAVQHFFQGLFQTMIQVTHLIMKILPLGVFCLVAKVFMVTGVQSLGNLALFTTTTLLGLATFMFVILPIFLSFIAHVNPITHFKAMAPALVTAFSTSSSSATLPITLDCAEKRAGISNKICSLVIPLGTSINMSGSALYECVAAMFIAQAYGIECNWECGGR